MTIVFLGETGTHWQTRESSWEAGTFVALKRYSRYRSAHTLSLSRFDLEHGVPSVARLVGRWIVLW